MKPIRLLAMDVDGTLVDINDNISQPVQAALHFAREAGVVLALATGRRYRSVLPLVDRLGLGVPLVTTNGALIKDPADHATLFSARFGSGVLNQVVNLFDEFGHEPLLYTDTWAQGYDIYLRTLETTCPQHEEFVLRNASSFRVEPNLDRIPMDDVFACFGIGDEPAMRRLETQLLRQLPNDLYVHVLRSPKYSGYMCEIAPAGVSKWTGVVYLAERLGLGADEICTVGDDVNDAPMLAGAGLGCAMANAPEEALLAADVVVPPVENDGLLEVVRRVLGTHAIELPS